MLKQMLKPFKVSFLNALTWTLVLSVLKSVYLNLKSKIRVEYIQKSASIFPVFYWIFNLLLKTCFWVCFCSSNDIILSYLVKNSMDRASNKT